MGDSNESGKLQWANSEIRRFVVSFFQAISVPFPQLSETQWFVLYRRFEKTNDMALSRKECEGFVYFLCEEILHRESDWALMGKDEDGNHAGSAATEPEEEASTLSVVDSRAESTEPGNLM